MLPLPDDPQAVEIARLILVISTLIGYEPDDPADLLTMSYDRAGLRPNEGLCRLAAIAAVSVLMGPGRSRESA